MTGTRGGRRLRVAVVGLEHYHVAGWVETIELFPERLEIVALYHPDRSRATDLRPVYSDPSLAQALDPRYRALPYETDLDVLIERHRPDLALVMLPNRDAPAAIARLGGAGIHLLVDKPASLTAGAAREAYAAARAGGARVVVGLTRRYAPAWRAARAAVAAGELGTFLTAEATFAASAVAVRGPANPIFDPDGAGGGILTWLGIHELDSLPWLIGEPVTEVMAMTARVGTPGLGVENVGSALLRFAGGGMATLAEAYALPARGYRGAIALRGTDASLELPPDGSLVRLARDPEGGPFVRETREPFAEDAVKGYGAGGRDAVADLLSAIDEGRDPIVTGDDLVRALELRDAAYASGASGRSVRLPQ